MADIERCRTQALGGHLYQCQACEQYHYSYHSCRNRHCPQCQYLAGQQWLARQQALLLPVPHFMVTFTLPEQLRSLARSHQKLIYNLLFRTSAEALQQLARDPRFVGGQIGMVGLLHTWSRDLNYHPHVHYLVPGGGLSADGEQWLSAPKKFLVHVKPLSKLFQAKFRDAFKKVGLFEQIPASVWSQEWVVHCQAVGNGLTALKYLAPYIFRVALTNRRIIKVQDDLVTVRYRPSGARRYKNCTLPVQEFMRRFLQHTLPKGFVKVRYYGLFSPGKRSQLLQARLLLGPLVPTDQPPSNQHKIDKPLPHPVVCPDCGQPMVLRAQIKPTGRCPPALSLAVQN
jgi:predicted RNA-binding Zn-ribbon protein involved in translation (DUF1610 family)